MISRGTSPRLRTGMYIMRKRGEPVPHLKIVCTLVLNRSRVAQSSRRSDSALIVGSGVVAAALAMVPTHSHIMITRGLAFGFGLFCLALVRG